ncbi:MAG: hypothetical protein AB7E31_15300 [Desulfitobacterium sp.]
MADHKRRILILVEGGRTDLALMRHLLDLYDIDAKYEIVAYSTNIYELYREMFDMNYTDILLIFDLDPQAPDFSPEKIQQMADYFIESSDMGKLYLNYPMVEAFYHMSSIPDAQYDSYFASLVELRAGSYKRRVNLENRNHDYRKFAINRKECNIVIRQNIDKAQSIANEPTSDCIPKQSHILKSQLNLLSGEQKVAVLSTCPFFIPDYNPALIR